ncbi:conserved protein of unknown function [Paraburkholderia dioscoreae]|uniref:Uncharacterized protein n=1 Tax=Paraburkholderia dioscoreae TaxID=2604047 RepID=A0A5Q4YYD1_9BURK|nr:conserved protein of unknown function [Paraburkholderia dioscoreae]
MTWGRRKHWRVRLAFEPNRYSSEQLEKAYDQLSPIDARSTRCASDARPATAKAMKRGKR